MTATQRDALVFPVAVVVLVAWILSLGASIITREYTPLTVTTPVMLMLAGYVFGVNIVKRTAGNGDS